MAELVVLDWRNKRHWNGGQIERCWRCGRPTLLLDDAGVPCHKGCAEAAIDDEVARGEQRARKRGGS